MMEVSYKDISSYGGTDNMIRHNFKTTSFWEGGSFMWKEKIQTIRICFLNDKFSVFTGDISETATTKT